ncbi:MAG: DUF3445 domain-containing protein [Candidatus Nanopelagicales bacterium]
MVDSPLAGLTPPLDGKPLRWSVGTRPIPLSQWLSIDQSRHRTMQAKDAVLGHSLDQSVITTPAGSDASGALLPTVCDHLTAWHNHNFTITDDEAVDLESGRRTAINRTTPLETLARMMPQDFCVLTPSGSTWHLTAATVCFTSRWNLESKMGLSISEIHQPVPGYEQRVARAVDRVIARLSDDLVLRRSNWTLLNTAELHLREPAHATVPVDDIDALTWLRIEHQTLRRFTNPAALIFTIDTRVHHVDELPEADRQRLRGAVRGAPADIAAYKAWPHSV